MLHSSRRASAKLLASLCFFMLAQPGASDDWTAEFVFPATTGYVMHNMDVMEVSYKSNYPHASLWCFCYNGKEDPANLVIMGVYKNAKPLDGAQSFQFNENFASDFCWYNLRNLDNEEKGLNGPRFSYDWKTRDQPSTLQAGSKPEVTAAPSTTADAPASTSASATSTPPPAPSAASTGASSGTPTGSTSGASAAPTTAAPGSSSATQTGGGGSESSSTPPKQGSSGTGTTITTTTKPPTGAPSDLPLLNSTAPLIGNGTAGGETGSHSTAPPALGSGVIAGIVVGAVLGVLGIFGFLGALWLVKRRRKSTLARQSRMRSSEREAKSAAAFGTYGRFEADGKSLPGELCGENKPGLVELPG